MIVYVALLQRNRKHFKLSGRQLSVVSQLLHSNVSSSQASVCEGPWANVCDPLPLAVQFVAWTQGLYLASMAFQHCCYCHGCISVTL